MKKLALISLTCAYCTLTLAQEVKTNITVPDTIMPTQPGQTPALIGGSDTETDIYVYDGYRGERLAQPDSLHLPLFNNLGQTYINMYPSGWNGFYDWQLHKGLNISLGASVFGTFGNSAWKGAGFTQTISAMYAMPVTKKLSIALGGYFNTMYWSHDAYRDGGINAVLGYKFDEHWEGYIFGQKSLANKFMPMPFYDISDIGDRIGASIKYNFNPQFSIQVTFETEKRP